MSRSLIWSIDYVSAEDREHLEERFYWTYLWNRDEDVEYLIPTIEDVFGVSIDEEKGAFEIDTLPTDINSVYQVVSEDIKILRKALYSNIEVKFGYISKWE